MDAGWVLKLLKRLFIIVVLVAAPANAETDVTQLDIDGYRLGMTIEDVKKIHSDLKVDPVMPDGKTMIGYKARVGSTVLNFTTEEFGSELFNIQQVTMFRSKPDVKAVYDGMIERYGRPDYSGRQMFHVQACWGKCFGKNKRLEFRIKIENVVNKPYPMTLTLSDPTIERKNRRAFFKEMESN